MIQKLLTVAIFSFYILVPFEAAAEVQITEIMYNPEGSDGGYEWIEVFNSGNEEVNISSWSFQEGGVNHRLSAVDGEVISAGSFGIIADDPNAFLQSYSILAVIFDSSFSLNNTGERLVLLDANDTQRSEISYRADTGASGNGNSLQLSADGWIEAEPTPGTQNASEEYVPEDEEGESDDEFIGSDNSGEINFLEPREEVPEPSKEPQPVAVDAGQDRRVIAGIEKTFSATSTGDSDADDFTYRWSFGNGDAISGAEVDYGYEYPGKYIVTLVAQDEGERIASDQVRIQVDAPDLAISDVIFASDGYVELQNNLDRSVDLAGWSLRAEGETFTFPEYVTVVGGETLKLAHGSTGLNPDTRVQLLFPNTDVAATFSETADVSTTSDSLPPFVNGASVGSSTSSEGPQANEGSQNNGNNTVETEEPITLMAEVSSPGDPQTVSSNANLYDDINQGRISRRGNVSMNTTSPSTTNATSIDLSAAFSATSQAAAAGVATGDENFQMWILLLGILVLAGSGALLLVRHFGPVHEPQKLLAGNFDIEEM